MRCSRIYRAVCSISSSKPNIPVRVWACFTKLHQHVTAAKAARHPFWSKIMRELMELSTKALLGCRYWRIRPVTTSAEGRCVATIKWIPAARPSCAMRTMEDSVFARNHHKVSQLVDDNYKIRHVLGRIFHVGIFATVNVLLYVLISRTYSAQTP